MFFTFSHLLLFLRAVLMNKTSSTAAAASNVVNVKFYLLDLYRRGEGETARTILTRCRSGCWKFFVDFKVQQQLFEIFEGIFTTHHRHHIYARWGESQCLRRSRPATKCCQFRRFSSPRFALCAAAVFFLCFVANVLLMCLLESIILRERFIKCLSSIYLPRIIIINCVVAGDLLSTCWASRISHVAFHAEIWSLQCKFEAANFHKQRQFMAKEE